MKLTNIFLSALIILFTGGFRASSNAQDTEELQYNKGTYQQDTSKRNKNTQLEKDKNKRQEKTAPDTAGKRNPLPKDDMNRPNNGGSPVDRPNNMEGMNQGRQNDNMQNPQATQGGGHRNTTGTQHPNQGNTGRSQNSGQGGTTNTGGTGMNDPNSNKTIGGMGQDGQGTPNTPGQGTQGATGTRGQQNQDRPKGTETQDKMNQNKNNSGGMSDEKRGVGQGKSQGQGQKKGHEKMDEKRTGQSPRNPDGTIRDTLGGKKIYNDGTDTSKTKKVKGQDKKNY